MIELSRVYDLIDVPKMCCNGSVSITNRGVIVLTIMHDTISINPFFEGIYIRGRRMLKPLFVHCISDDGIMCLMVVGRYENSKKVERVIIPFN